MEFGITIIDKINMISLSAGLGVCLLCLLLVLASVEMMPKLRSYYIIFFMMLFIYISAHLSREIMSGLPGSGVRIALYTVTFLEVLAAGLMTHMISMLILFVAQPEDPDRKVMGALGVLLIGHVLILAIGAFTGSVFYFDAANEYYRGSLYILSNLCPAVMLLIDVFLLVRHSDTIESRLKSVFWFYILAPVVAIVIQGIFYGLQLIIIATLIATVYAFFMIVKIQDEKTQAERLESSRIETELSLATKIQADMLPSLFPAFPEREEFDLYASMTPAKEVGGDFYDFFLIDDDHLGLVIADVSGKGIPAAMFMMFSKNIIANNLMLGMSPAKALYDANNAICKNNTEEMFVTVWVGVLEIPTGKLTCANGGHEYPVIKHGKDEFELLKDKHGTAVGVFEESEYEDYELMLSPGDKIFVYTDGVPEATAADKSMFTVKRIPEVLNKDTSASPKQMFKLIWDSVEEFVDGAEQFDDLTVLALEYIGKNRRSR